MRHLKKRIIFVFIMLMLPLALFHSSPVKALTKPAAASGQISTYFADTKPPPGTPQAGAQNPSTTISGACTAKNTFFFIPPWYKYLADAGMLDQYCNLNAKFSQQFPGDIWLIGLAILDMLLRLASFAAIVSIIVAGVQHEFSGGNAETAANARRRIWNSLIGLAIAVAGAGLVAFIGNKLT